MREHSGFCAHAREHLGYVKGAEFLERLVDCQFLKKSAPWNWLIIIYLYYILFICILYVVDELSWNRMSFQFLFISGVF
jgi:hypothetical protein